MTGNINSNLIVSYGHLECLKYAHENGCEWDIWTCSGAAKDGHLDCLKYAHENGCPWDKHTHTNAIKYGRFDCLKYIHDNGCGTEEGHITCIINFNNYVKCLQYIQQL